MKNLFKKLHIVSNQSEVPEGSSLSQRIKSSSAHKSQPTNTEHKHFSSLSNWLLSIGNSKHSPSSPRLSDLSRGDRMELPGTGDSTGFNGSDDTRCVSGSGNSRDPEVEEEYQIQLALELSAKEDPEAVQIEAVKQISLGSCGPENTPAEVVAYRYWNYNALGYDDKIMDGFYDLYGVLTESNSERMPALVHLQGTPVSDNVSWEAVLINRAADATLLGIEHKALEMAEKSRSGSLLFVGSNLVKEIAILVVNAMGGPVKDPDKLAIEWTGFSQNLKAMIGSMVLPLGSLEIGLARHRALLFKVLADSVGIPCQLVKGKQYTGSDEVAMNIVKLNDEREYIVDLMADPGTLIPSDAAGSHVEYDESVSGSPLSRDIDSSQVASFSSGVTSSFEDHSEFGTPDMKSRFRNSAEVRSASDHRSEYPICTSSKAARKDKDKEEYDISVEKPRSPFRSQKGQVRELPGWVPHPNMHARSPSWTEGVSSPSAHRMKVKDVSRYMIDAAKENPQLVQRLHDVLLESGVIAPPNLFAEVYSDASRAETNSLTCEEGDKQGTAAQHDDAEYDNASKILPPRTPHKYNSKASRPSDQSENPKHVEGLGFDHPLELREGNEQPVPSQSETTPARYAKDVPVAAAAAAAAAVVASSMVVAAAKSTADSNIKLPVAAAAAAVVATTAAVGKKYDHGAPTDGEADGSGQEPHSSRGDGERDTFGANFENERISNRSIGNDSTKSDVTLDDVVDCEIPWEDITVGERIGIGSYGEVYRGDWHGTEVAVKRFVDQDIFGDSLEEIKSEVRIMKRLRHPNVVLFMGAVTRPPNLSIITEFLPRGSLYRLLHRPNNQLDERRRLRMALDAARGMNYLHNCSPVIVHRDLKSPNLLVDKNWVVKVCDFGLSRMKYSTFLSSRSTAGTAEWMAPEVLRNEPSNEKCDVYSFGVILWELCTMQQPWTGLNAMQVVGAVGFQHRRLDIPENVDPAVADIIRNCWQTDPKLRPTFAEIMAALKPLQKPITAAHVPRPIPSMSIKHDRHQQ